MRVFLPELVGNAALCERLGDELSRGALAHAYIIEGESGCGKHTLARNIVMALACHARADASLPLPCGKCPSCRKILEGNCPDILTVTREAGKATMSVDVIRALRDDVATLPNDLDFKIYVIEDAHTMTTQAQNALLLTLEEPPPFVLFLLLAKSADALLETIRSRAPVLRMQPISDDELRNYLLSPERGATARAARALADASPEEFASLVRMSNGRIGRALELLEEKKRAPLLSRRADAAKLCELLASGLSRTELLIHVRSFGKVRDEVCGRLVCVNEALRDLLALTVSDEAPLVFFTDREHAQDLAACFTTARVISVIEATDAALDALGANANVLLTLTHYLCRIAA